MPDPIVFYGHAYCPQVHSVQAALDKLGVEYTYVDIRRDEPGRLRVREINAGNESVPTLVFPDGSTLTEPSIQSLRKKLDPTLIGQEPQVALNARRPKMAATVIGWLGFVVLLVGFALDLPWLMLIGAVLVAMWFGVKSRRV